MRITNQSWDLRFNLENSKTILKTQRFSHFTQCYSYSILHSAMGWLRLVGSLKLQVSFAECSLFYRALSQKRPIILWSQLIVATPYSCDILHSATVILFYNVLKLFYFTTCYSYSILHSATVILFYWRAGSWEFFSAFAERNSIHHTVSTHRGALDQNKYDYQDFWCILLVLLNEEIHD